MVLVMELRPRGDGCCSRVLSVSLLLLLATLLWKHVSAAAAAITRGDFPEGFVFGTAASAYQVEGMAKHGGRGPSIWDAFIEVPGKQSSFNNTTMVFFSSDSWDN